MPGDETAKADGETSGQAPTTPASEWTASDARGPLNAVGDLTRAAPDAPTAPPEHDIPEQPSARDESVAAAHGAPGPERRHDLGPQETSAQGTSAQGTSAQGTSAQDTSAQDTSAQDQAAVTPPPSTAEPPRRSLWPLAAAIIVGAIIGAASAATYYAAQGGDASQVAALSARVDALQHRPDPQPDIASLKSALSNLSGKIATVQKTVETQAARDAAKPAADPAALQQKIAALSVDLEGSRKQAGADLKAVDAKVAALAGAVAALNGIEGKIVTLRSSIDGITKQSSAAQASIETLRSHQTVIEGKVTSSPALAVVADSLVMQIARGEPYATQVEALTAIGADPARIAVLKESAATGVPSAKALAAAFEPLADPMVASERHAPPNAGFLDRLKSGLFSVISIRRVDDVTSDTTAAHIALIQADLAHDDVAGAYAVWSALPAAAKVKSDAWGARAKTHAEAMQAARALQSEAIAALGTKKS